MTSENDSFTFEECLQAKKTENNFHFAKIIKSIGSVYEKWYESCS